MSKYNNISDVCELEIRRSYSEYLDNFNVLKKWVDDAVGQKVVHMEDLYTHKVRIKKIESLLKKVDEKICEEQKQLNSGEITQEEAKWTTINDFNDIVELIDDFVGARIITYVNKSLTKLHEDILKSNDMFEIEEITFHEFDDRPSFKDVKQGLCSNQTRKNSNGYVGIHYIIKPKPIDRCWKQEPHIFKKFELQIRSLLQETWGEIQHSVIYKGRIPEDKKARSSAKFATAADMLLSMDRLLSELAETKYHQQNKNDEK